MNRLEKTNIVLLYDGDCPACRFYVATIVLPELVDHFEVVNARTDHPLVQEARQRGLDLNTGIVLVVGETMYHGATAMHHLARLCHPRSLVGRLHYWLLSSSWRAALVYPVLTFGRRLLLWVLRVPPLSAK